MTIKDITTGCQNCGGLRKEHGMLKPYRCATRLKESYWLPWTVADYQAAVAAGKAIVANGHVS